MTEITQLFIRFELNGLQITCKPTKDDPQNNYVLQVRNDFGDSLGTKTISFCPNVFFGGSHIKDLIDNFIKEVLNEYTTADPEPCIRPTVSEVSGHNTSEQLTDSSQV